MEFPNEPDGSFNPEDWEFNEANIPAGNAGDTGVDGDMLNNAVSENLTSADNLPETNFSLPEAAGLAGLFDTLAAFNQAEDSNLRMAHGVVDGLIKQNHKDKYVAEGMTENEAVTFIEATEGERSAAEEAVVLDLEMIAAIEGKVLRSYGLALGQNLLEDAHAQIVDGRKLVDSLDFIAGGNAPAEVQRGLATTLEKFNGSLWATVINNHGEEVDALGARPFWMSKGYIPEPENHERMVNTLEHGNAIADQCERLGVSEEQITELRQHTRYYEENMIVEWAIAKEMGFFDSPFGEEGMQSLYRQEYGWQSFWNMMDFADAKSMPGDTFVAEVRDRATEHMGAYLRAILSNRRSISAEADAELWPDRDIAEQTIAVEAAKDAFIARLVATRTRLQQYGHKYDAGT